MVAEYVVRPIDASEWDAFARATFLGFHEEPRDDEIAMWREEVHLDRTLAVFDGARIVATAESMPWDINVPYASPVRCAAVTSVTVTPTHRRRGLLRRMMTQQLEDVHAAGEPLAALYASEAAIYPRFGYGIAAPSFATTVHRDHAALRMPADPSCSVQFVTLDTARQRLPAIYDRALANRPGAMAREAAVWRKATVFDPDRVRHGFGPRQAVVAGDDRGYALYRIRHGWANNAPDGTVRVEELLAVDAAAEVTLWSFLFGLDLMSSMEAANRPADDPLRFLLLDPAREIRRYAESFFLRVVDIPTALTARGYAETDRLVLAVTDPLCPWNTATWALQASPDGSSCTPTDDLPDLELDVRELGAVYLGGVAPSWLAAAGLLVEHTDGAVGRATRLFAGPRAPWNPTKF